MKKYLVKIPKEYNQDISNLEIQDVKVEEDCLVFKTNKKSLNILKNKFEHIYFIDIYKKSIFSLLSNHFVTIIGGLLLAIMAYFLSKSVTKIVFLDASTYNEEVYNYVCNEFIKIGPFRLLKRNLNDLDKDLKREFYEYEWIGISRKGTVLNIEIYPSFVNNEIEETKLPGSIFAKKSAIVKKYHLEKGIVVVIEEQYVNKGDLLISGDIIHYGGNIESIHPIGYVIGEVLEYRDFVIPKTSESIIKSGNIKIFREKYFKNKLIGKDKKDYDNFEFESKIIFNLFGLFFIKETVGYEIVNSINVYDLDSAIAYSKSIIYKDFIKNKSNKYEMIEYIKLVRSSEDENNFYFRFVVKSKESIGEFVPKT